MSKKKKGKKKKSNMSKWTRQALIDLSIGILLHLIEKFIDFVL